MAIDTKQIIALRERTGLGLSECQRALAQADGDLDRAVEILRKAGALKAAKKIAERTALQGIVAAYVHAGDKVGAMVVVNCETDFVARTEKFRQFAHVLAMQVAASSPQYVASADVPADVIAKEREIYQAQVQASGKPAAIVAKIIEGKLQQFYRENCLLEQPFIKDDARSVQQALEELIAQTGEKIAVKKLVRFQV